MWNSTDPRLTINKWANIVILRPDPSKAAKWISGTGHVDTKNGWNILTTFDDHSLIDVDDKWDPSWFWVLAPEEQMSSSKENYVTAPLKYVGVLPPRGLIEVIPAPKKSQEPDEDICFKLGAEVSVRSPYGGDLTPVGTLQQEPSHTSEEVGFYVRNYQGVEVYHKPDLPKPKTEEEWNNYLKQLKFEGPIKDRTLKPGTEVVFQSLFGGLISAAIVEANGELYAENESSIYNLNWDVDDRHCWSSSNGFNKKALRKVMAE